NDCNDNADCTDKTPGYECKCKTGFTGDGTTHCDDIDECANSTLNDCTGGETCMNNAGGYICGCNAPYVKNGANCYCDLTGMWGMRQDVNTTYPHVLGPGGFEVIMAGSLHTTVWELHQMTYDGTTVKVKKKGCGPLQTPDLIGSGILAGETYGTYIPQSVWNAFPLFTGVDVPLVNAKPGSAFVSPKEAVALGIKLNNPLTDAWPSLANAVHDDAEGDGVDGLMIWAHTPSETTHAGGSHRYSYPYISTNRAVCVTTATRVINHLDGTVVDCKKITGDVKRDLVPGQQPGDKPIAEQHTYDCRRPVSASTSYGCTKADWDNTSKMTACSQSEINGLDAQVDQTTTTATFELVKLSDDPNDASVDCNMVRSKLPAYP
ncbi:MAG TPA: hypothetical protein VHM19_05885, partial [Polyangiales bacterium]|nr:hypothetical protein [Polyangiales bacterium]